MCKLNEMVKSIRTGAVAKVTNTDMEGKVQLTFEDGTQKLTSPSTLKRWYKVVTEEVMNEVAAGKAGKVKAVKEVETPVEEVKEVETPVETPVEEVVETVEAPVEEVKEVEPTVEEIVETPVEEIVNTETPVEVTEEAPVEQKEEVKVEKVEKPKKEKTEKPKKEKVADTDKLNRDELVAKVIEIMNPEEVKENKQHTDLKDGGKAFVYIWKTKTTFKAYISNKVKYDASTLQVVDRPNCGYGLTTQITLTSESQLDEFVNILTQARDYNRQVVAEREAKKQAKKTAKTSTEKVAEKVAE